MSDSKKINALLLQVSCMMPESDKVADSLDGEIAKLELAARRWDLIEKHHLTTRAMTRKGKHLWSFKPIWKATGETAGEVIDNEAAMFAICEENNPGGISCRGCPLKKPKCGGVRG